jgi:hypothetical protein
MNQNLNEGGTPKSFEEAVFCGLQGPLCHIRDNMKAVLRDYLAQKFQVALMKCHTPEQQAIVEDLWLAITGERLKR